MQSLRKPSIETQNFRCLQRFQKEEDQRQCRHDKHGEPKANTRTDKRRPMTQRWVSGPLNSLASREQVPLTEWRPLFTRLGVGRGTFFPAESAAPQRGRGPRPYAGWPPFIESFLLRQIPSCFPAGPRIYTGLSCLSTGVIIYPSPLSCKCSLLPVKGSWTSPRMLCPMSESPSGKREGFQDNATRKKREVYY